MGIEVESVTGRTFRDLENTDHASNRARERNIGASQIIKAIEKGEYEGLDRKDNEKFRLPSPGVDLWVHVDPDVEKIVTVYYDDEQGATGGAI